MSRSSTGPVDPALGVGRINTAYACGGLKPAQKAILAHLALRYNEEKGCAWASVGGIAHACSLSPATVTRALKGLGDSGLITRTLRDNSVKKSRKTFIHWDEVAGRASQFRPPIPAKHTAVSVEDAAIIEGISNSSDEPMDASRR
jgi:DNA-binding transcriptional ArsR family regulator